MHIPHEQIQYILKSHQLRHTDCREEVLGTFLSNSFALTHADIEKKIKESFDRVTIYRTLKSFLDKGIIHKVLDDEGTPKYALCSQKCNNQAHNHEHVHFKCLNCGQTQCIEEVNIPKIDLPKGFAIQEANLLIQGFCNKCNK
ncbi:MAG: Fur family transcriptional regulator [Thermonemataceae bacterium]